MWLVNYGSERVQCTIKESINIDRGLFVENLTIELRKRSFVVIYLLFRFFLIGGFVASTKVIKKSSQIKVREREEKKTIAVISLN